MCLSTSEALWSPSDSRIEAANLTAFIQRIREKGHPQVSSFEELYQWSVEHPTDFWAEVWHFCEIRCSDTWDTVARDLQRMPGAKWFEGARLNFAENLLRFRDEREALVFWGEKKERQSLSYQELYREVARVAKFLRTSGVQQGDRVAGFLPNIPETVIAMLAASSIGAIWSSCSPDFGIKGVLDRFGQIEPKVLFTADGYFYNGKVIDSLERVHSITNEISSIEKVVVIPFANDNPEIAQIPNSLSFTEIESSDEEIDFAQLPFDHPLYIMYSSGTTGVPKCIVHGAGGTLIQHLKEHVLHTDLKRDDRVFYFTTCGWMMWNWLVSGLAVGSTLLLYDGSPFFPDGNVLFDLADQEKMTVFGTSAKYISAVEKAGLKPRESHDLSSLRAMLSTGSPLLPESFDFVYRDIKSDLQLSSIAGGTDIISCFVLGNPIGPVYRSETQTRGLGMDVHVFDGAGRAIIGEAGELVCSTAFPSMPIYFWNDPNGTRYHASYFDTYENIWRHGDWVELTAHGGMIIYGRSDATLNPGGVRIGTAEIYRQVETFEEIIESLVVGQQWDGDERVILFVRLREGETLDDPFRERLKKHIRANTTPRHVPAKIVQVRDIPRTISGKIVELAVKNILHGRAITNADALANPQALEEFTNLKELES